ncbi:hypothetical protein SCUP234_11958 [Seiridium cupressi]
MNVLWAASPSPWRRTTLRIASHRITSHRITSQPFTIGQHRAATGLSAASGDGRDERTSCPRMSCFISHTISQIHDLRKQCFTEWPGSAPRPLAWSQHRVRRDQAASSRAGAHLLTPSGIDVAVGQ